MGLTRVFVLHPALLLGSLAALLIRTRVSEIHSYSLSPPIGPLRLSCLVSRMWCSVVVLLLLLDVVISALLCSLGSHPLRSDYSRQPRPLAELGLSLGLQPVEQQPYQLSGLRLEVHGGLL